MSTTSAYAKYLRSQNTRSAAPALPDLRAAKGYYRKFDMCRLCLRELALRGEIPGLSKPRGRPEKGSNDESNRPDCRHAYQDPECCPRQKAGSGHPSSKLKVEIAKILKEEGYIRNFKMIDDNKQGI